MVDSLPGGIGRLLVQAMYAQESAPGAVFDVRDQFGRLRRGSRCDAKVVNVAHEVNVRCQ